jgi:hypothetical protein
MTKIPEQAKVYRSVTTGINENTLNGPTRQPGLNVAHTTLKLTNEEKQRQAARGRAKLESKFNNNPRTEEPPVITFDKVMDHIEAEPDLAKKMRRVLTAIQTGGLGHVLWGSKPCLLMQGEAELLNWLQDGYSLKENFLLLEDRTTEEDAWQGLLINKYNLRKMLEQNPDVCASSSFTEGETDVNEIINLLEKENLTDALLEDGHFLGTILGYGPGNALNFAKLYGEDTLDHERAELDASSVAPARRFADELWANSLAGRTQAPEERFINTPSFRAWDTNETNEVVNRHLNESIDMREIFLKEAADSGNYPRNAVRAFLEGVFDTDNPKT